MKTLSALVLLACGIGLFVFGAHCGEVAYTAPSSASGMSTGVGPGFAAIITCVIGVVMVVEACEWISQLGDK